MCDLCSTPFGITDYIGAKKQEGMAIRMNGCSTPFGINGLYRASGRGGRSVSYCAQRLSASRIISGRASSAAISAVSSGAQRLSASRIISGRSPHQQGDSRLEVLNAFRHHGLYRVRRLRVLDIERELCSTPFGITDYIGTAR